MTGAVHAYGGPFPGICDCVCTLLYPKFQSHQVCVIAHALPTSHHPRQSTNAIPAPPRLASPSPNTHRPSPRPARRAPRASPQRGSGCAGYTDFRHMLTALVHCARRCANRSYFLLIPAPYLPSVYTSVPRPPTARSESGDPTPTPADRCAMRMESHGRSTSIACFTLTVGFSAVAEASHVLDTPPLQLASDHTACPHRLALLAERFMIKFGALHILYAYDDHIFNRQRACAMQLFIKKLNLARSDGEESTHGSRWGSHVRFSDSLHGCRPRRVSTKTGLIHLELARQKNEIMIYTYNTLGEIPKTQTNAGTRRAKGTQQLFLVDSGQRGLDLSIPSPSHLQAFIRVHCMNLQRFRPVSLVGYQVPTPDIVQPARAVDDDLFRVAYHIGTCSLAGLILPSISQHLPPSCLI